MKLHHLKPAEGAKKARTRVGRGRAGKGGKTAGRGSKGWGARHTPQVGFEGGQMPLIRRIPKRGFNNARHAVRYVPVNLESLNQFKDGDRVDADALRKAALETDIPDGGTLQGYGVAFNGPGHEMAGQNNRAFTNVTQYLPNGEIKIVFPKSIATADPILPLPTSHPLGGK